MAKAWRMLRLAALPILLLPAFALAQAPPRSPAAPAARPDAATARQAELDRLFEALRDAPDTVGGQLVEQRIRAIWARAVSPAATLLLRRGARNLERNVPDEALEDFDAAITLEPDAPETWLMRARALAALGDRAAAARDIQQALRLEPRHFGALIQLSQLQTEVGDHAGALRSFDAALVLHPKLPGAEERRRELRRQAEGDAL
jgi:tetratricopeptide (TPR) repeat protein